LQASACKIASDIKLVFHSPTKASVV